MNCLIVSLTLSNKSQLPLGQRNQNVIVSAADLIVTLPQSVNKITFSVRWTPVMDAERDFGETGNISQDGFTFRSVIDGPGQHSPQNGKDVNFWLWTGTGLNAKFSWRQKATKSKPFDWFVLNRPLDLVWNCTINLGENQTQSQRDPRKGQETHQVDLHSTAVCRMAFSVRRFQTFDSRTTIAKLRSHKFQGKWTIFHRSRCPIPPIGCVSFGTSNCLPMRFHSLSSCGFRLPSSDADLFAETFLADVAFISRCFFNDGSWRNY